MLSGHPQTQVFFLSSVGRRLVGALLVDRRGRSARLRLNRWEALSWGSCRNTSCCVLFPAFFFSKKVRRLEKKKTAVGSFIFHDTEHHSQSFTKRKHTISSFVFCSFNKYIFEPTTCSVIQRKYQTNTGRFETATKLGPLHCTSEDEAYC